MSNAENSKKDDAFIWDLGPKSWCSIESCLSELEGALRCFRQGAIRNDGGRRGMQRALFVSYAIVGSFLRPSQRDLLAPLLGLHGALRDLDGGKTHPALKKRNLPHRTAPGIDVACFKATCIVAVEVLRKHKKIDGRQIRKPEADKQVAKLAKMPAGHLGVKGSIESWRREVNNGAGQSLLWSWVQIMRNNTPELRQPCSNAQSVVDGLLASFSEERLSHLPNARKEACL